MKFKIGDRVRVVSSIFCNKGYEGIVSDIEFDCDSCDWYISLKDSNISLFQDNFELVESSEDIAVEKFKEEFRQILQKRLLEHKSCKDYWCDYLKKNSDTINKFDGECIVSDLNKINNYIYELEKVLFLFEKNSCKHKLENEDK